MCGIVGIIGAQAWYNADDCFKYLLVADTLRGPHSTGVFHVNPKGECKYYKTTDNGVDFAMSPTYKKIISTTDVFYGGHNRWATVGAHTEENAHPFSHNGVTGIHNGTLRNYTGLYKPKSHTGPVSTAFGTDSETVYYTLGWCSDVKKVLGDLEGAFALVWHDMEDNCVRVVRNTERPLWFAKVKGKDTLVYASEEAMAVWAITRAKGEVEWTKELPAGELWRFDLSQTAAKRIKPFIQQVTLKKKPVAQTITKYSGGNYYSRNGGQSKKSSTTKNTKSGGSSTNDNRGSSKSNNVIQLPNGSASANKHQEPVDEFLAEQGLDRDADLFSENIHNVATGRSNCVTATCEIGNKPFLVRAFISKDVQEEMLANAEYMGGNPVGLLYDRDTGEPVVILKPDSTWIVDYYWLRLFGDIGYEMEDYWAERARFEEKDADEEAQERAELAAEMYDSPSVEFDDDIPFDTSDDKEVSSLIMGPNHTYISKEEFKHLTKDGCTMCHTPILEAEAELVEWEDSDSPVCHHCQGGVLQ